LREGGKILRVGFILTGIAAVGIASARHFGFDTVLQVFSKSMLAGFVATLLLQGLYLTRLASKEQPLNRPKWLFLIVVLATHNIILLLQLPVLVQIICLTIFHNIQYHRIVRFHNGNQYGGPEAPAQFGFAATLAQRVLVYIGLALVWSLFPMVPRAAAVTLIQTPVLNFTLSAFFWGIAFNHYFLDAVIWRVRRSTRVAQSLQISRIAATA
jgi:hypothetical protein